MKTKKALGKKLQVRRFSRYFFILFLVFLTLGAIRSFTASGKDLNEQAPAPAVQEEKVNHAASIGAVTFAEDFAGQYFRWEPQNNEERANTLQPFLRKGLDRQAGLRVDTVQNGSRASNTEAVAVEETGKNTALITIRVNQMVSEVTKEKNKDGKEEEKKEEKGPFTKYIKVPIISDGNGYLVNSLPTFTNEPPTPDMEAVNQQDKGQIESTLNAEIQTALEPFFKTYTIGSNEELAYYTTDPNLRTLGGAVEFKKIDSVTVYKNGDKTSADVIVQMEDAGSKSILIQKFELKLEKNEKTWIVKELKNI